MCGGGSPKPTTPRDPVEEERQAAAKATQEANASTATRKKYRRSSTLLANVGGSSGVGSQSVLSQAGKDTFG